MKTLKEVLEQLGHTTSFGVDIKSDETREIIPIEKLGNDLTKYYATQCALNDFTMRYEIRIKKVNNEETTTI